MVRVVIGQMGHSVPTVPAAAEAAVWLQSKIDKVYR